MKPPKSLTDEELKAYAEEHLQYELDMLVWAAGILATLAEKRHRGYLPWALNNAVLNSYSLHARNLIAFLYSRSQSRDQPSDVIVQDYISDALLAGALPEISPPLEGVTTKANKQVAHLTIERIEYEVEGKEWRFLDIANDIMRAFQVIAHLFPESRLSQALREKLLQPALIVPAVKTELIVAPDGYLVGVSLELLRQSSVSDE